MLVTDFDYHLPKELIAQKSIKPRDHSRLLVVDRLCEKIQHEHFYDLPKFLKKGDLLVFNDTKVFKARLFGKVNSKKIEIFLLRPIDKFSWQVLAKPGKKLKFDSVVKFGNGLECSLQSKDDDGVMIVKFNQPSAAVIKIANRLGHIPVPPYVETEPKRLAEYQTIYARHSGSVAAPTAGFHLTPQLFKELSKMGVKMAFVTLHVGLGTFRPVKTKKVEDHKMHSEWVNIGSATARAINRAKEDGRRVIAVGTTTARALEGAAGSFGKIKKFSGDINFFITPGFNFKIIDGLITNFHLPKSTLLMLVSAFIGDRELALQIYNQAVKLKYRFFSFGDAMLICPLFF
ncbi:MAG: S-adenosylmethionine:tRNA ribosyltransferase-isomerase [Candidatus Magasanikbacteria bacterium GW2011_GWC2_41_17]|uniref:S-adenosylmethionine:tRNA ribosyltransferase-isomerase n=2 Tax=Candidatus Magasanikiibacteriota TaxID=1752731 RepID=A0A0G0YET9_9BACT|nr:MAG: S-adenosylmethionine:tRNA ribosyltransferase-isomerase [Candidatus Magasanikbacteria bacterium GW2011_GWC2_41_17]